MANAAIIIVGLFSGIIVGLFSGFIGAVVSTRMQVRSQREAWWRDQLIAAAAEFVAATARTIAAMREVDAAGMKGEPIDGLLSDVRSRVSEYVPLQAQIRMLYGKQSEATGIAAELLRDFSKARSPAPDEHGRYYGGALTKPSNLADHFCDAALKEVRSEYWPAGHRLAADDAKHWYSPRRWIRYAAK